MSLPYSITPAPLHDPAEAGSVWRTEKLREFAFKAKVLNVHDDPEIAALLAKAAEHTAALEALATAQADPVYERPWWQDGEYDDGRADSANDAGVVAMKAGRPSEAFNAFTEAIRLCPTSPVYHCNRAAAGLRLGQPRLAAEDAAHAIERDAFYVKAYLRGGAAQLALDEPEVAVGLFKRALELEPGNAVAAEGLAQAELAALTHAEARAAEAAAAAAGSRTGLTREAVPEAEAAGQLLAATAMMEASPRLEAAKCAVAEALILCGRYADAAAACKGLLPGADRSYLEAESAWRWGNVDEALRLLQEAAAEAPDCRKAAQLLGFLKEVATLLQRAEAAAEEGALGECVDAASQLLACLQPRACTGLYCATLQRRADAQAARGNPEGALADLDAALQLDAGHAGCLRSRAQVHKQLGRYTEYFLDVQRLSKAAPGTTGLFELLQEAAQLSLGAGASGTGSCSSDIPAAAAASRAGQDALATLGLTASANAAQVRRAYLVLAAKHHPDKWAGSSGAEQRAAEARFKEVQHAYELLSSGSA